MRIIFMGSPEFAAPTLQRLIESEHHVAAVVTQPDRPAGRGRTMRVPAAKELAAAHGIAVLQPESVNSEESLAALRALQPDALVIAAYGQILKQPLLDVPKRGSLNVHASLLPKYRGAAPAAAAILAGEDMTGVSILEVVLALDAGPIVAQREASIGPHDTTGALNEKLSQIGADLLIEVLPAWERGETKPRPQDGALATYAPSLRRDDAKIDWSLAAIDVWRRVRAYNPWPVTYTSMDGEVLRILEASSLEGGPALEPGTVFAAGKGFAVRCGTGSVAIVRAQRAGKRAVTGEEFLRGRIEILGRRLGT